jgi:hypothetical protein
MPNIPAILYSVLMSTLLFGNPAQAECGCLWEGSFTEVQSGASIVLSGTVTAGKGNSIDLRVDELMRGAEGPPIIRVWLKDGDYCRPEASLFPQHSQWVMALHRIEEVVPGGFNPGTPNFSYGRKGDYSLSSCGGYWLQRNEQWVTGNLINAPRWVREPKMTPVLIDVISAFVRGEVSADALVEASEIDPALRELMNDTKAFLRE